MFENLKNIFKRNKKNDVLKFKSKDTAKERLHLVLMQDRANVSVDFLELMRKEIIEVIKKYIDIDEKAMDVRLTTETNENGIQGAPALYANIPIINIKEEARKMSKVNVNTENKITVESKQNENEEMVEKNEKSEEIVNKEVEEGLSNEIDRENEVEEDNSGIDEIENNKTEEDNSEIENNKIEEDNSEIHKIENQTTENNNQETDIKEGSEQDNSEWKNIQNESKENIENIGTNEKEQTEKDWNEKNDEK